MTENSPKKSFASFLARKAMAQRQKEEALSYLLDIKQKAFSSLLEEGLISSFSRKDKTKTVFCLPNLKKEIVVKVQFIFERKQPFKQIASSSNYISIVISPSIKDGELEGHLRKEVNSRIRGFSNEDSFERNIIPLVRRLNRVSHANKLSNRADSLGGVDFEIEYYTDRYYSQTETLLINVKSSDKYSEAHEKKYPNVYPLVYDSKMPRSLVIYKIKRLMVMAKNKNL